MFVAGALQDRHRHLEKLGVCVRVLRKFAARVAQKELCVLLIRQAIGGDMIRLKGNGLLQRQSPLLDGLAWQTEHQIDVDVREPGCTKKMKRMLGLLRAVFSAQQLQQLVVPRLNAEADSSYSQLPKQRSLAR